MRERENTTLESELMKGAQMLGISVTIRPKTQSRLTRHAAPVGAIFQKMESRTMHVGMDADVH